METLVAQLLSSADRSGGKLSEADLEERAAAVFREAAGTGTLDRVRLYNLLADRHVRGRTAQHASHPCLQSPEVGRGSVAL
jgi:hypothetical protein